MTLPSSSVTRQLPLDNTAETSVVPVSLAWNRGPNGVIGAAWAGKLVESATTDTARRRNTTLASASALRRPRASM